MRAVIRFLILQGKAPKEIHAILTETSACFLPGRAKDLLAPLYETRGKVRMIWTSEKMGIRKMYFSGGSLNIGCMNLRTDPGQKNAK